MKTHARRTQWTAPRWFLVSFIVVFVSAPAYSVPYLVRSGDTLSSIAERYDISLAHLVTANGIGNPDSIRVGQRIVIPNPSLSIAAERYRANYGRGERPSTVQFTREPGERFLTLDSFHQPDALAGSTFWDPAERQRVHNDIYDGWSKLFPSKKPFAKLEYATMGRRGLFRNEFKLYVPKPSFVPRVLVP